MKGFLNEPCNSPLVSEAPKNFFFIRAAREQDRNFSAAAFQLSYHLDTVNSPHGNIKEHKTDVLSALIKN